MISTGILNDDMLYSQVMSLDYQGISMMLSNQYENTHCSAIRKSLKSKVKHTLNVWLRWNILTPSTDLFQRAILHGYVLDGSYTFLNQKRSLLAFVEKCMNENLFLDPINHTWHACPKTQKQAITVPDSERRKASMEKKLDTFEKMGIWQETSYLSKGDTRYLVSLFITQDFE